MTTPPHTELDTPDVEFQGVTKAFGDMTAVDDLSLRVRRGEFLALLGPSGCGKTTCLRMIAGFEEPSSGTLRIVGRDMTRVPPKQRPVNTVFQDYALFGHLDVLRNVEFGLKQARVPQAERRTRAMEALEMVRLQDRAESKPNQLSGGQRQRVALARALVLKPQVLLLDEPLAALDLQLRKGMQNELRKLHRELGITFIFVTHDQGEALSMADRIAVMDRGRIEQLSSPEDVYLHPATPFVASFIGEMNLVPAHVTEGRVESALGALRGINSRPDGDIVIGIRPESVSVAPRDVAREGSSIAVTVTDRRLVGEMCRIEGRTPSGTMLIARRPRQEWDALAALRDGEDVAFSWDPADLVVLDRGA